MKRPIIHAVGFLAITAGSAPALGQDSPSILAPQAGAVVVEDSLLAGERGGEGGSLVNEGTLLLTNQTLNQENSSRLSAGSVRNGDVAIADNAFSNAGMGNYVFTSGSSNTVQAALSINLIVPSE
jgi:hypothetical protein